MPLDKLCVSLRPISCEYCGCFGLKYKYETWGNARHCHINLWSRPWLVLFRPGSTLFIIWIAAIQICKCQNYSEETAKSTIINGENQSNELIPPIYVATINQNWWFINKTRFAMAVAIKNRREEATTLLGNVRITLKNWV